MFFFKSQECAQGPWEDTSDHGCIWFSSVLSFHFFHRVLQMVLGYKILSLYDKHKIANACVKNGILNDFICKIIKLLTCVWSSNLTLVWPEGEKKYWGSGDWDIQSNGTALLFSNRRQLQQERQNICCSANISIPRSHTVMPDWPLNRTALILTTAWWSLKFL